MKDKQVFCVDELGFNDADSILYVYPNMSQKLEFPQEYPALIQVHREKPARAVPLHWHPGPELIYSLNKNIVVIIDGKRVPVKAGEFALISSYALHAVEPDSNNTPAQDVLSIAFQARYLERMLPHLRSSAIDRDAISADQLAREQICSDCRLLHKQIENCTDFFEINRLLFSILQNIYGNFYIGLQTNDIEHLNMRNKMMEVLAYIDQNYQEPLTTQSLADHFGYTREYFCRIFKQYGGQTFKQYLTELRLTIATQELVSSSLSIGEIAMEVGFPDEKSFFSAFKREHQITPAQYRKNLSSRI
jgi:AraC-like DNA-binding protein